MYYCYIPGTWYIVATSRAMARDEGLTQLLQSSALQQQQQCRDSEVPFTYHDTGQQQRAADLK